MPRKRGKKTGGIKMRQTVKQKVIVNVNTGRSSRRPQATATSQRPISSGSSAPVVILQPQPQITPQQQQLQPQAQSQQVEERNRRLQSQQTLFSQQTKSLQDIIDAHNKTLEEVGLKKAIEFKNRSHGQLNKNKDAKKAEEDAKKAEEAAKNRLVLKFPDINESIDEMEQEERKGRERIESVLQLKKY